MAESKTWAFYANISKERSKGFTIFRIVVGGVSRLVPALIVSGLTKSLVESKPRRCRTLDR